MAENDSNLIKPVNVLHGIIGSKPVKQRKGEKRRQNSDKQEEETKQQFEDAIEQQNQNTEHEERQNDSNSIDYCA